MKKILALFVTLLCAFPQLKAQSYVESEPFYFIQITDPQLGMIDHNKGFEKETKIMEKVIADINKLSPKFVVCTGDNVNKWDDQAQIDEFDRLMKLIRKDIPVYVLPGNHDIDDKISGHSLRKYRKIYGYDCFSFNVNNTCFVGFNSSLLRSQRHSEEYNQRVWMEKVLENAQHCNHRILFGHYPFFVHDYDESEGYNNIPMKLRKVYLDMVEKYNVSHYFAGHLHNSKNASYKGFQMIVTNAVCHNLSEQAVGIQIIKVYPDKIVPEYYYVDEIPSEVNL